MLDLTFKLAILNPRESSLLDGKAAFSPTDRPREAQGTDFKATRKMQDRDTALLDGSLRRGSKILLLEKKDSFVLFRRQPKEAPYLSRPDTST